MKQTYGSRKLSVTVLLAGLAALALRMALYAAAVDAKGLLLRWHPLEIALTALTLTVLALLVPGVRKQEIPDGFETHFPASLPGAFGSAAAGAGILVTALAGSASGGSYLDTAWQLFGLAAPVCFLLAGLARALGKKPFFLLHVVICLFFVLHIVIRYQLWSGNPQLQDYVFSLLGAMVLMFFGFYNAAREAGCGNYPMQLAMGLAAVYFCLGELARSSSPALYLGGLLWVLTEIYAVTKPETT